VAGIPGPVGATTSFWAAIDTGLRVSELTGLCNRDVELIADAHLNCAGEGPQAPVSPLANARRQKSCYLI